MINETNQIINSYVDNLTPEAVKMALKQVLIHGEEPMKFIIKATQEFDSAITFPISKGEE